MTDTTCSNTSRENGEWLETTSLFQKWNEMKKDILLHKWYESEKAGYDIGWERASVDWMVHKAGD